jgi:hypothetical protein
MAQQQSWYPYPTLAPRQAAPSRLGRWRFLLILLAALALGAVLFTVLAALLTPSTPTPCTRNCGPVTGQPIPQPATYRSSAYGFTVAYSDPWKISQQDGKSVLFETADGKFLVYGQAAGKSDQQLVEEGVGTLPDSQFQSLTPVGGIRGLQIGYQNGAGTIYSATFLPEGGRAVRARIAVMAATRKGVSVTAIGINPLVPQAPNGMPESSQFDQALSQFQWKS